jgi:hypothetical protein
MRLTLVVSGLPAFDAREGRASDDAAMPALPVLSRAIARARMEPGRMPWHARLAREVAPAFAAATPGSIAAAAVDGTVDRGAWLAQPVHLRAALDHVRLPAAGLLELDDTEARALAEDFARAFASDGLALHPVGNGLVLSGLAPGEGPPDPSALAGSRLDARELAASPALRRLGGEIEMWLHPLNESRIRAGRPAVTGLWIWGGGTPLAGEEAGAPAPRIHGRHPVAVGLAALGGEPAREPADFAAALAGEGAAERIVELPARSLPSLEALWLEPALAALGRGELRAVRILLGDQSHVLGRHDRLRIWRRMRPWWEHLRR